MNIDILFALYLDGEVKIQKLFNRIEINQNLILCPITGPICPGWYYFNTYYISSFQSEWIPLSRQ